MAAQPSEGFSIGGCTQFTGLQVSITAPGPGTIVVWGWDSVVIYHTMGTRDNVWVKISQSPTDCIDDRWLTLVTIDSALPSDSQWPTMVPHRIDVVTAGSYTYYTNGVQQEGMSGAFLRYGTMVATFYPS